MNFLHRLLNRTGLRRPLSLARAFVQDRKRFDLERSHARRAKRFADLNGAWISKPGARTGPVVLVVSLFDAPFSLEYEMALVKALDAEGAIPVILASTRDAGYAYYRMFGMDRVLFFDDFVRAAEAKTLPPISPLSGFNGMQALRDYAYRGVRVGRHALSLVSRTLRQGRVTLDNPKIRAAMEPLWAQMPGLVAAANDVIDAVRPTKALFLEIGYAPFGELFETCLARGVDTIEWTGSHRLNSVNLKRYSDATKELHPQSLSPETWEQIRHQPFTPAMDKALFAEIEEHYESGGFTNEERLQFGKQIKPGKQVLTDLGLDPNKKTAVIFSHILWDATFFYGKDLFDNYAEWLVETVRAAVANPNVNWIVKMHPANAWKLKHDGHRGELNETELIAEAVGPLPPHIKLVDPFTDINTFSLFSVTDYCLTVRGTIGIEMPCYGIPAVVAGTGRYAGYGFTNEFSSKEDYLRTLAHLETVPRLDPARLELAKKHGHAIFVRRPLDMKTVEVVMHTDAQSGGLTERDTLIHADSLEAYRGKPDVRAFADWVLSSSASDYLQP